jgi:hypothetical protein
MIIDFLVAELRHRLLGAFLAVMDMIALPEWSPDLVAEADWLERTRS